MSTRRPDLPLRPDPTGPHRAPLRSTLIAMVGALAIVAGACSSGETKSEATGSSTPSTTGGQDVSCPAEIDETEFASAKELRDLLSEFNSFGMRSPASDAHEASIDWLAEQLAEVPGMKIEYDEYTIDRWQPTTEAAGDTPGRDLAAAGGLSISTGRADQTIEVVGAVPFTLPTNEAGVTAPLVYLPLDQEITPENAEGRIVVREIEHTRIPSVLFEAIGHYVTDDVDTSIDYDRPYLRPLDDALIDAGLAGAAGMILVWDAPTDQLSGYWDPHTGTRFHLPAVFTGSDTFDAIRSAAQRGDRATVVVRAKWDEAPTRNLIATLPGQTRERIVVNANTDSVNWVQENGTVASIALARYLGSLPVECRQRDVQFALTSNHLGLTTDGTFRYGPTLDDAYDDGTVAFVMAIEHLGTRELLPVEDDPLGRLEFTGEGELFAWSAPAESPTLVEASVAAAERRGLTKLAILQGVGLPVEDQVPKICSQGGLGSNFHKRLIPTIAGISGPWSLWAPVFGEDAVDFDRMRDQTLAFGDIAVRLDDISIEEIGGEYPAMRERRAQGAPTCPEGIPPAVAPTPDPARAVQRGA